MPDLLDQALLLQELVRLAVVHVSIRVFQFFCSVVLGDLGFALSFELFGHCSTQERGEGGNKSNEKRRKRLRVDKVHFAVVRKLESRLT